MSNIIPLAIHPDTSIIRKMFIDHLGQDMINSYKLVVPKDEDLIVGLSGGADSSVLAMFFGAFFGDRDNIHYLFTDTMAEPESAYATLDALEALLGIHINRIEPEDGFFELIEKHGGFLPSPQKRWCTTTLKIEPLKKFMKANFEADTVWNAAGIRSDEAEREGFTLLHKIEHENRSILPFVELGVTRDMVFDILRRTIGIPETYHYRTRSGCFSCYFQKRSEFIGMLFNNYRHFIKTEQQEKLTQADLERWPVSDKAPMRPMNTPRFVDIRDNELPTGMPVKLRAKRDDSASLLGADDGHQYSQSIFVAQACYIHPGLSLYGHFEFTSGQYWSEFITFSTSQAGLNTALGNYIEFKRTTPDGITDMRHLKVVVYQIAFKDGGIDVGKPSKDSYTWKSGEALRQLRSIAERCTESLYMEEIASELKRLRKTMRNTDDELVYMDASELAQERQNELKRFRMRLADESSLGTILWSGLYQPAAKKTTQMGVQMDLIGFAEQVDEPVEVSTFDDDRVPTACLVCSL